MREFQEKLEQLMELAAKQEKNLNNEQILEIFGLNQLSPQQLQSLYEYLRIQGIRIQGADLAPMDIGKALDPQEEQEEEKKPVILEAEDEQCLKEYEEMLRQFPSEKEGEREALLLQAVTDVAGVQERLAQLYLKEILQYARKLWRQGIYIGDLIQEGNMSLLLALAEEMPEESKAGWMEQRLLDGMESWVKEQTEQKYRDESMVEKVRKLEAAIRELSDDEEQKFSVEELAAYLDMDEEEREEEKLNIRNGLNFARKVLVTEECDVLILDEVLGLVEQGIVSAEEVHELLGEASDTTELIFTGIKLCPEMMDWADDVYQITALKES